MDEQDVFEDHKRRRQLIPKMRNEQLVAEYGFMQQLLGHDELIAEFPDFEGFIYTSAGRPARKVFNKAVDEQHRLTVFALEQELLKCLQAKGGAQ